MREPRQTLLLFVGLFFTLGLSAAYAASKGDKSEVDAAYADASEELRAVLQDANSFDEKRWFAAQSRKQERAVVPVPTSPSVADLAAMKGHRGLVLLGDDVKAKAYFSDLEKGRELAAFGGVGISIETAGQPIDAFLVVPLGDDKNRLAIDTIRFARWNEDTQDYSWIPNSGYSRMANVAWVRIARGGKIAMFGEWAMPELSDRLRSFCTVREGFRIEPELNLGERMNDLCPVILCPAMGGGEGFDGSLPDGPGFGGSPLPGGNLCDICLGTMPVGPIAPCDIYVPGRLPGPCESDCGWSTAGPLDVAGHIRRVVVDPTNANRLYAVGFEGGVFALDSISDYPSVFWRALTDQNETLRFSSMAIAPSLGTRLYAGSQFGRVYRSGNRGLNWLRAGADLGGKIIELVVHPSNADTVWAINETGLFESVDGGETWTNIFAGNMTDFKLDPGNPDTRYLAESGIGVHKTSNAGGNWDLAFDFADANAPEAMLIEIALGVRNVDGSMQAPDSRTVVVRAADEVWINETGGTGAWTSLGKHGNWGTPKQLGWNHLVAVSPFDPRVIFAGGRVLHRRKADDSNSWDHVAGFTQRVHEDQHSIAFHPSDPDIVYLSNDGGVFRSFDGGKTFGSGDSTREGEIASGRNLNFGLVTAEFYRVGVQGDNALGNLYHSGIIGSLDLDHGWWTGPGEGHSWEFRSILSDQRRPGRFFVLSGDLLIRLFSATPVERPLRRFAAFKPVPSSVSRVVGALAVDRRSGSATMLASAAAADGEPHRLMRTLEANTLPEWDEAASTWSNLPDWTEEFQTGAAGSDQINAVAISPVGGKGYAMTASGRTFVKADVDSTAMWQEAGQWVNANGGIRQMAVSPSNPDLIFAMRRGNVARSYAAGADGSWEEVGGTTLPLTDINAIAAHPRNEFVLFISSEDGVYMSVDQGGHWEPIDNSLPNASIRQIFVEGDFLYAVTHGRGLWRLPLCAIPRGA